MEEALRSTGFGHWYEYIKAIVNGCRAEGVEVELLAHKNAEAEIIDNLRAQAVLRYSAWDRIYYSPSAWKRYLGVIRHNLRLAKDVGSYLSRSRPFDIVLAPTNLPHHVLGWQRVAKRFAGRKFNRLVMIFVNTPGKKTMEGQFRFPWNARFQQAVLRKLAKHHPDGCVTLAVETSRAAEQFEVFSGARFALLPHVVSLGPSGIGASGKSERPVLGSFGFARHEKGSDLLQIAVTELLRGRNGTSPHFVIQWGKDFQDDRGTTVRKCPELVKSPRVTFIDQPLNSEEYASWLSNTDGVVLPYRQNAYYDRVSRVAIEAASSGLPFVYPCRSWLEDLVEKCGAGIGFEDGNVRDLTRALRKFVENLPELRQKAGERAILARRYHSPQRFKRCLFGERDDLKAMAF